LISKFKEEHGIEVEKGFEERHELDLSDHVNGGSIEERNRGPSYNVLEGGKVVAFGDKSPDPGVEGTRCSIRTDPDSQGRHVLTVEQDRSDEETKKIKRNLEEHTGKKLFFPPGSRYDHLND